MKLLNAHYFIFFNVLHVVSTVGETVGNVHTRKCIFSLSLQTMKIDRWQTLKLHFDTFSVEEDNQLIVGQIGNPRIKYGGCFKGKVTLLRSREICGH